MVKRCLYSLATVLLAALQAGATVQEPAPSRAWVRSYVSSAATTNGVTSWDAVTNWVMRALRANGTADTTPEEDVEVSAGRLMAYSTTKTASGAVFTPRSFAVTSEQTVWSNVAARVVSSSLACVPTGSVFTAFVKDGALVYRHYATPSNYLDLAHAAHVTNGNVFASFTATNAAAKSPLQYQTGTNVWRDVVSYVPSNVVTTATSNVVTTATTNAVVGSVTNAVTYSVTNAVSYSVTNVVHYAVTNDVTNAWTWVSFDQDAEGSRYVRCVAFANGSTNIDDAVGSFTLEACRISEGDWLVEAAKYKATEDLASLPIRASGQTNLTVWADRYAPSSVRQVQMRFQYLGASNAVSTVSWWQAFLPMAYAQLATKPDEYYNVTIRLAPDAEMIDFPPPDDEHFYKPSRWYSEADWNNPANWVSFPISVKVWYQDENDSLWYPMQVKIKSLSQLNILIPGIALPPSPYVGPVLCERKDYCKEGRHLWEKCVCTKCGLERAHGNWVLEGGSCARCGNMDSTTERNDDGELVPTDSDRICGEKCESDDLSLHAGWHDGGGEDYDTYSCGCECGFYGYDSVRLAHELEDVDPKDCTYKNETVHKVKRICSRCEAVRYYDEQHATADDDETAYAEPIPTGDGTYDQTSHLAYGTCEGCEHQMSVVEAHAPDEECLCRCGLTIHDMEENACGFIECTKCGYIDRSDERNLHPHVFGKWVDNDYHSCYCGVEVEVHTIKKGTVDGALVEYCEVCKHVFASTKEGPKRATRTARCNIGISGSSYSLGGFANRWRKANGDTTSSPSVVASTRVIDPAPSGNDPTGDALCLSMLNGNEWNSLMDMVIAESANWYERLGAVLVKMFTDRDREILVTAIAIKTNGQWKGYLKYEVMGGWGDDE